MGCCGNVLWVVVWGLAVIFMGYYVACGCNFLRFILLQVVVICYVLLRGEWW